VREDAAKGEISKQKQKKAESFQKISFFDKNFGEFQRRKSC